MEREYQCLLCQAKIPPEDINVSTYLALCRACGDASSFSIIIDAAEISLDVLTNPPRGVKIELDAGGATVLTYKRLTPLLFFLIPFTALWSGLSMLTIYGSQIKKAEFDPDLSLAGLPFVFGSIALLSSVAFLLFGYWRITLRKGTGSVFVGVGSWGWTRTFKYGRDTLVSMRMTNVRIYNAYQEGILIRNGSTELVFGTTLREEAKQYVAALIAGSRPGSGNPPAERLLTESSSVRNARG